MLVSRGHITECHWFLPNSVYMCHGFPCENSVFLAKKAYCNFINVKWFPVCTWLSEKESECSHVAQGNLEWEDDKQKLLAILSRHCQFGLGLSAKTNTLDFPRTQTSKFPQMKNYKPDSLRPSFTRLSEAPMIMMSWDPVSECGSGIRILFWRLTTQSDRDLPFEVTAKW